ncbi:MAG TPA: AGE family epimerase/isomerase [Caulobacter sp.]|nr:AGE family epimerase/isomerase [Caulobacter sp.]
MVQVPFAAVRRWLFDEALPFWGEAGIDRVDGGYVEQLDFEGQDAGVDFKRVRVVCRQIYVFSHASTLGWAPGLELARHGYEFLTRNAWLGAEGGWARVLTRQGEVRDTTPDLYDIAFAMFALGWYGRASGEAAPKVLAMQTLDFLEANMRPADGLGFLHEKPAHGSRLQNPHMHLLEAALVCLETYPDPRFETLARQLVELFSTKLFNPETGTLSEYFTDDWSREPGERGRITEPGHQLEWAWILANAQRLLGMDAGSIIQALVASAERHGVDPVSHATYNEVRDDGAPINRGSRSWPNTERIKAHVALFETFGTNPTVPVAQSANLLLGRYLATPVRGLWIDQFDGEDRPTSTTVPASTLYHVFLAFAELLRLEGKV